ncbi:DinB family protein [Streptomyces sp. NPDC051909]|uniref:DinB family protein n=1 Tax=Streptomyces sp. NPDC051909 TaxID=3154944 RepID=UPI003414F3DB
MKATGATLVETSCHSLVQRGHFPANSGELDWTPRQIMGHLTDSARVFSMHLQRILDEMTLEPLDFPSFEPLDEKRVASYAKLPWDQMLGELIHAQAELHSMVTAVSSAAMRRVGFGTVGGAIAADEIVRFLSGHQDDHATQLEMILANLTAA